MSRAEDLVRRYYAAFNARDFAAYDGLFSPDCSIEAPGVSARGIEAVRGFDRVWTAAFPEARVESMRTVAVGRFLATGNWLHGGPQRGPLHGPGGTLPALGKIASAPYCAMFELDGDGESARIKMQKLLYALEWLPVQLG